MIVITGPVSRRALISLEQNILSLLNYEIIIEILHFSPPGPKHLLSLSISFVHLTIWPLSSSPDCILERLRETADNNLEIDEEIATTISVELEKTSRKMKFLTESNPTLLTGFRLRQHSLYECQYGNYMK